MSSIASARPPVNRAEATVEITKRLLAEGFYPGVPPWVRAETVLTDRRVCHALRCPGCRRRGLVYIPFFKLAEPAGVRLPHEPPGRYVVLAACKRCSCGEVV